METPDGWVWPWYAGSVFGERGVLFSSFGPRGYTYSSDFSPGVVEVEWLARSIAQAESSGSGLPGWELAGSVPVYGPLYVMPRWDADQVDRLMKRLCDVVGPGPDWGTVASRLSRFVGWDYDYRYDRWVEDHFGEPYNPHLTGASENAKWIRESSMSEYDWLATEIAPVEGVYQVVIDRSDGDSWASLLCTTQGHLSLLRSDGRGMLDHCDHRLRALGVELLVAASRIVDRLVSRSVSLEPPGAAEGCVHVFTDAGWHYSTEPFPAGLDSLAAPVELIAERIQELTSVTW